MSRKILMVLGVALLLLAAAVFAWSMDDATPAAAQDGDGECGPDPCPAWIVEAWAGSGHADSEAEAFRHWDEEEVVEVPAGCAKCHSEAGYLDFLGADGSEFGVVDMAAPVDTVVSCTVCHNPVAIGLDEVTFPSGVTIMDVGDSARCMQCHQGRESGLSVTSAVEESGLGMDEFDGELGFINIHYFAAAASLYGGEAMGGFQYEGMAYDGQFGHVEGYSSCANCHSPHSLELKVEECAACHVGVESVEDIEMIRMPGSTVDYDGDGDTAESLKDELDGLHALLYQAIQAYATEVVGASIAYDAATYPYWFVDGDGDGMASAEEATYANHYVNFTPRLLQAAYNYQVYAKDPGAFAHNGKYHVQLMYDSIMSLNEMLTEPVDLSAAHRNSVGHFDSTAEAFRHWDEDGEVSASCTKCHTAEGLPFYLMHGVTISGEPASSLECTTCHDVEAGFAVHEVTEVEFPSGAVLGFEQSLSSNLCINCHQGRESTVSVDRRIAAAGVGDDEVSEDLGFINVHYFAAGATLFGADAQGAYMYEGKEYMGPYPHVATMENNCVTCHDPHSLAPQMENCTMCHAGVEEMTDIRLDLGTAVDYDGDGDVTEGIANEIATMHEALYAAITAYAADTAATPIRYDAASYPYWFVDDGGEEAVRYASWTPALLRAAYNYQYVAKDPGAFTHNGDFIMQVLYDSIESMGGPDAVAGMTRP